MSIYLPLAFRNLIDRHTLTFSMTGACHQWLRIYRILIYIFKQWIDARPKAKLSHWLCPKSYTICRSHAPATSQGEGKYYKDPNHGATWQAFSSQVSTCKRG